MAESQDDINKRNAREAEAKAREAVRQSIIQEAADLKDKTDRLSGFVNGTSYYALTEHHRALVTTQLNHMKGYLQILQTRLRDWDK